MGSGPIQVSDVHIELPIFEQLLSLDTEIKQRWEHSGGFEELGLVLHEPSDWENGGYWCTPLNTLSFGGTGMDGEHFSFLVMNAKITHHSPVIMSLPCNIDVDVVPNVVLAKNFTDFLRLGLHHGFSSLVDMGVTPKAALALYLSDYAPVESANDVVLEEALDDRGYDILDLVAEALALRPCTYTVAEFILLQERYMPLLMMSADYDDPNVYS